MENLDFEENVRITKKAVELAHSKNIPVEAELGAVLGHEKGPLPPYEELFETGKGFTDFHQAETFVKQTGVNWLSVAVGNIHGAISGAAKDQKKVEARLNLKHLRELAIITGIPLVLHGGSGIKQEYVLEGIKNGICKINIGTEIRQAYESCIHETNDIEKTRNGVADKVRFLIEDYYKIPYSSHQLYKFLTSL
ncbi:MAG: Fructose-bisphosphate aldolase [candidate division WS2 bacterium]|nr:Fructose-bisphosphate aldolase [Candidatus Psychracetigena formicireducens]